MYVIGLTGGVGSGKSAAAGILQNIAGAQLLLADDLGHAAMEQGTVQYGQILHSFGEKILCPDRSIDRKKLAEVVFEDEERMEVLNGIIHPFVLSEIGSFCKKKEKEKGILVIESAILFESGCHRFCDTVWGILVPREKRLERLSLSRGYTKQKSESVMSRQMSDEEFCRCCQHTIYNDGSMELLEQRLKRAVCSLPVFSGSDSVVKEEG